MTNVKGLLRNRDFIMVVALALGLIWGGAAPSTERATLPLLMVVMTLATMGVSGTVFRSPRVLVAPALAGVVMNYLVLVCRNTWSEVLSGGIRTLDCARTWLLARSWRIV